MGDVGMAGKKTDDNYIDTAYRMSDSVKTLRAAGQWMNACYLSGYIAECYCKLLLQSAQSLGYVLRDHNLLHSHKISGMGNEIITDLPAVVSPSYCVDLAAECSNIVEDWTVNMRHESNASVCNHKDKAEAMEKEAEKLMTVIMQMQIDGVIG